MKIFLIGSFFISIYHILMLRVVGAQWYSYHNELLSLFFNTIKNSGWRKLCHHKKIFIHFFFYFILFLFAIVCFFMDDMQICDNRKGKRRVTRMVVVVVLAFAICWLPIQVSWTFSLACNEAASGKEILFHFDESFNFGKCVIYIKV